MKLENEYRSFPDGNFGLNDVSIATLPVEIIQISDRPRVCIRPSLLQLRRKIPSERHSPRRRLLEICQRPQMGQLPSVSAAWRISEEKFMEATRNYIQNLKLRAGYGVAGNNKIDNNMYATEYGSGHYGNGSSDFPTFVPGTTSATPNSYGKRPRLSTSVSTSQPFNSRVNLQLDWYNNQSDKPAHQKQDPSSTGYTHQFRTSARSATAVSKLCSTQSTSPPVTSHGQWTST